MGQLGFQELLIIAVIALIVFGPKKLPELGAGLGSAIRDFKRALNDTTSDTRDHPGEQQRRTPADAPALAAPAKTTAAPEAREPGSHTTPAHSG